MARNITKEVLNILEYAERPLFLGEIVAVFDGDYDAPYIMPILSKLKKRGLVDVKPSKREGYGRKIANVYFLIKKSV